METVKSQRFAKKYVDQRGNVRVKNIESSRNNGFRDIEVKEREGERERHTEREIKRKRDADREKEKVRDTESQGERHTHTHRKITWKIYAK